jgi:hypothetical protein
MKTPAKVLVVMVTAAVLGFIALDRYVFPSFVHRYRLTIELDDDGRVRSGSGVVQVTWTNQPKFGEAPPWVSKVKGQAIFVNLETRGAVLALLSGGYPLQDETIKPDFFALRALYGSNALSPEALDALGRARVKKELGPTELVRMLWLPDINNPATAQIVDLRRLGTTIDPKLRFRRAEIELTGDSVTTDLSKHLPWLKTMVEAERRAPPITWYGEFKLTSAVLNRGVDP